MCENCNDFQHLLYRVERDHEAAIAASESDDRSDSDLQPTLKKSDVMTSLAFLNIWHQKQCMCVFRDVKNLERFSLVVQCITKIALIKLKEVPEYLKSLFEKKENKENEMKEEKETKKDEETSEPPKPPDPKDDEDNWSLDDTERLLTYMSRVFMLQFPLYLAAKQAGSRLDDLSQAEATSLAVFLDVSGDVADIPLVLLRNVARFCRSGGLLAMTNAFKQSPNYLPPSTAHGLVSILCNLKLWLNPRAIAQLFGPVRMAALQYMCGLSDQELRHQPTRAMADFLWSSIKDNLESPLTLDKDGLELAFKYFCSPTLTMRLCGINQVNAHISLFNEMCNTESVVEVESIGLQLAQWILDSKLIEHIFGPNLHVEVIKQSHVILNFLAMEGKITNSHMDAIWQSAQLKHCSKQVHDLLPPLIKNLEAGPVLHLYELVQKLPVKEHTEQTIYLAQVLQKFIWTSGGTFSHLLHEVNSGDRIEDNSDNELKGSSKKRKKKCVGDSSDDDDLSDDVLAELADLDDDNDDIDEFSDVDDDDDDEDDDLASSDSDSDLRKARELDSLALRSLTNKEAEIEKKEQKGTTESEKKEVKTPPPIPSKKGKYTPGKKIKDSGIKRSREAKISESEPEIELAIGGNVKKPKIEGPATEESNDVINRKMENLPAPVPACVKGERSKPNAWGGKWSDPGQGAVMTELANLVGATGSNVSPSREVHDMFSGPFIRGFRTDRFRTDMFENSGEMSDDGSANDGEGASPPSSHASNKSDKNMGDFADEESADEEMVRLAQAEQLGTMLHHHHQLAHMAQFYQSRLAAPRLSRRQRTEGAKLMAHYRMDRVAEPGNTLLWDLIQDGSIELLAEGLANEAEKALTNLLCYNMERYIRVKFIEGCLSNLEHNRSVVVSLRLLPKLFQSFHNFPGTDTHEMTLYTEKTHEMTKLFFENLKQYTSEKKQGKDHPFYSHTTQIQARLQFLAMIFSNQVSPDGFRLNQNQVSTLWECLANDSATSDDMFQWLLVQAHSKDQHALGIDSVRFIHKEKLPALKPETMTMTGLNLLSQLTTLVQVADGHPDEHGNMNQVWRIALQACNTDVSMKAIHILNSAYLGKGEEFLTTCMEHLKEAGSSLSVDNEDQLVRIHRALLLLKSHLETFRKKYAYHFRRLAIEGQPVSSHAELVEVRHSALLRIVVQPGGAITEKVTFDMHASDLVADLRAEITVWWEGKISHGAECATMLGSLLGSPIIGPSGPTHLRLISQGQEISQDLDERTLSDLGFKDLQLVFASLGSGPSRGSIMSGLTDFRGDLPPFPGRDKIPMLLLLQPSHFGQLFSLMSSLSKITSKSEQGQQILDTKAQIMSRRVWEILLLLPTNPKIKQGLQEIDSNSDLVVLLDPESPQKLLYTFYIIDWLGRPLRLRRHSGIVDRQDSPSPRPGSSMSQAPAGWVNQFIQAGGLKHLFNVFVSGILGRRGEPFWCEWRQDCLGALLRLLVQFGVDQSDADTLADQLADANTTPRRRLKWNQNRKSNSDRMLVPILSSVMIDLMEIDQVMPKLGEVFLDSSSSTSKEVTQYKTGLFGRSQVVHFAMSLLVSWIFSAGSEAEDAMFTQSSLNIWLKHLLLEDHDPAVRREMCTGIYRMCLGTSSNGKTGASCIAPMLSILLEFFDNAQMMKPQRRESINQSSIDEPGKEPFGPACRDYFWVLCKLVENLKIKEETLGFVDIESLAHRLCHGISARPFYEKRQGGNSATSDDALIGMINLMSAVLKHNPDFKQQPEGQEFVEKLFMFLFALPSPTEKLFPKCKSQLSRTACYDLLVEMIRGCLPNYSVLHGLLVSQHQAASHKSYQWEYWPREEGRSECGYVGLVNLGATCYMATCVQQLFMIPAIRACVLQNDGLGPHNNGGFGKHLSTLYELRRMFAYLLESERKAYNPLSFCKTYTMDHQPLNTGEQKDMAEFFIDLLSKTEEMTPELKNVVKTTFCGTLSNNVVSLDCGHVSTTTEEFYTVRCQVAEMRSLYQSLEEVCVKDMLEGDNMYTCSQCSTKVRAEKRACFKSLPDILAFNTMRYSFNMVTMMKEKVNTHFSFPFRLDMTPYMEHTLIPKKGKEAPLSSAEEDIRNQSYEYELIGVTVHTGNADGGHYYAFIRDRTSVKDKWYSFNDAEVKSFDPNQIASECFGGEMSSRTYDQVTDKFLDLSIEKTNSAYMLFYERVKKPNNEAGPSSEISIYSEATSPTKVLNNTVLSPDLEDWIWQDNRNFIQDNNIFDHTYFNFMWQMVQFLPTTLNKDGDGAADDITLMSARLATSFFLETFIHAKEKLNIVQWVEVLTKQLDSSIPACRWFLDQMANDNHWPVTIFLKCNIATIRQMFHRLVIHVIQKLRPNDSEQYILPWQPVDKDNFPDSSTLAKIGSRSPITRFVRTLLHLLETGTAKPHLKHLTELFSFLLDFAKLGDQEAEFLLSIQAITTCVEFYLKICGNSTTDPELEVSDDDESEDDIIALPIGGSDMAAARTASLDKMVSLIAVLVEKSRGEDNCIHLSQTDLNSLTSGKTLLFLYNITRDNINIRQTCNLIFSLTRHNPSLAEHVAEMVFLGVKSADHSLHFFRLLTLLTELSGGPAGLPCYTTLIMYRVWDLAKSCPQAALDWLSIQVTRNRYAQSWLLGSLSDWVEIYLIAHNNVKVRNSAAFLLVSLVPTPHFRQTFRTPRNPPSQLRDTIEANDGLDTVRRILEFLLSLLKNCKQYIDISCHGTTKLVSYFQVMTHLLLSKHEKLLLGPFFQDLWQLFHPKLSEPSIPVHQNKQALLHFWYSATVECPENIKLILTNPHVVKNIAFNYILADHEDSDVVNFNRTMLPTYYGLLRLCCSSSRSFCRTLAAHQNIQWAFKNIAPYSTQYAGAVDELMKLTQLFVSHQEESTEEELNEIRQFRTSKLQLYLSILDGRTSWGTLISVLKILIESTEDKLFTVCNNGLSLIYDAFNILHLMHHEATACHVTQELRELLTIFTELVRTVRSQSRSTELRAILSRWKDMADMTSRLLTLCNSFSCYELREVCLGAVKEMLLLWPNEMLTILVPMFHRAHVSAADTDTTLMGPNFPRRERRSGMSNKSSRPPRPMLQLAVPANQLEASHGQDPEYDRALHHYFWTYHNLVDLMVRVAVNEDAIIKMLIDLSAMVGLDGVPLHFQLFPKLWLDIYSSRNIERSTLNASIALLVDSHGFLEYVDAVLLDERLSLNNQYVFQFLYVFFPKVADQVLTDQVKSLIHSLCKNLEAVASNYDLSKPSLVKHLNGDLRALLLVQSGVKEINTTQLKEAVLTLKQRTGEQLEILGEDKTKKSEDEKGSESQGEEKGGSSDESRKSSDEKPKSLEEKPKNFDEKRKSFDEKASEGSSKRMTGNERLRETCLALERSLDMLLTELGKVSESEEKVEKEGAKGAENEKEGTSGST